MSSTSTTDEEAEQALLNAFVTSWGSTTPFTFDNEEFEAPKDAPWVRMATRLSGGSQETLGPPGSRRFERRGTAFLQVFVPQHTGKLALRSLTRQARETFEGVTLAGTTVRFGDVVVRDGGPDGSWFMSTVEAPFAYDEKR